MGKNHPIRHHYVPRMLLKNFCGDGDSLWVGDRKRGKCYQENLTNACVVRNLYTSYDFSQKTDSYEFEYSLSEIESKAEPAISSIIEQVRRGDNPQLDTERDKHLKEFVLAQARRTPESQKRVFSDLNRNSNELAKSIIRKVFMLVGKDVPEKDWSDSNSRISKLKQRIISNGNARFAAGEHHTLRQETEKFSREAGWGVAFICMPRRSFVIGSHGITIIERDETTRESWLPIAHDMAIQFTLSPDRGLKLCLDRRNESVIKSINRATAKQSDKIFGRSKDLVCSLMRKC